MTAFSFIKPKNLLLFLLIAATLFVAPLSSWATPAPSPTADPIDTLFPGVRLPNADLLQTTHNRYIMLITTKTTVSSIKYLDRSLEVSGDRLLVIERLYNGSYTNTDSVILDRQTLLPLESYSDINTSKEGFTYTGNRVTGTMESRESGSNGNITKLDTVLSRAMFNGLTYAETYQARSYRKGQPVILAEYVPGHGAKFTRMEYITDGEINLAGIIIPAKLIEARTGNIVMHYWLQAKSQELLKVEAQFPNFSYSLSRVL